MDKMTNIILIYMRNKNLKIIANYHHKKEDINTKKT